MVLVLRLEHGDARITLASDERGLPYDRVALSDHLAGHKPATELPLHPKRWYRDRGIAFCAAVVDVVATSAIAYRKGFLGDDLAILAVSPGS